jgi:ABC-2 type transport system permease protein
MYLKLVKLFLKENFSLKRLLGFSFKKEKVKGILISLAILYALLSFVLGFGYLFFDLGNFLNEINQIHIILSFLTIYLIGMSIMIVLFRASGSLFYYKDYDIIAPLPISHKTILFAKASVLLIFIYISSFIFTLPITFSYFYYTGFNILKMIYFILGFLVLPFIPFVVMSFISLLVYLITHRLRQNKIISIILLFVIFISLFVVSFSFNQVDQNPLTGQIELFKGISNVYIPFIWFINAVDQLKFLDLLYLLVSHIVILILFINLIANQVLKLNQRGLKSNTKKNGKEIKYQVRSTYNALIKKEFKKFFNIPIYAVNAGLGPVLLVVLSIASLIFKNDIEEYLALIIGSGLSIEILLLLFFGFCIGMTYTPAISLSLEGKNLWIIKSLPLKAKEIMYSKIMFNILLVLPISIVAILILGISLQITLLSQVLLILLATTFSVLISVIDSIINLYLPKFDFVNEIEVIKQSLGALLGVFMSFGLLILNGVLYYLLYETTSLHLMMTFMLILNIILIIPSYLIIRNNSEKVFQKYKA